MVRICFLILFLISNAFAGEGGGMVSSGGMIFQDANNPWFLVNTKDVKYCVQVDEETFSMKESEIVPLIEHAIFYWVKEFQKAVIGVDRVGKYNLGTQIFTQEECNDKTDLRFLFGYKTLKKEAIEFLKDPRRYIGVSVRESYDEENLRGKGFVYIASDMGNQYSYYRHDDLIAEAWKHPKLLTFALIHEMGHVFGIPHQGAGVMGETFLDQMLNEALYDRFLKLEFESFIAPDRYIKTCTIDQRAKTYLNIPQNTSCIEVERTAGTQWKLYTIDNVGNKTELGVIDSSVMVNFEDNKYRNIGTLRLTNKQKVFTAAETMSSSFMYGPFIQEYSCQGILKLKTSAIPKKVMVRGTPDTFHLAGELKGEVFDFFSYFSKMSRILFFDEKE